MDKTLKLLNPTLIGKYEVVAPKYRSKGIDKITEEVNIPASAIAEVPDSVSK